MSEEDKKAEVIERTEPETVRLPDFRKAFGQKATDKDAQERLTSRGYVVLEKILRGEKMPPRMERTAQFVISKFVPDALAPQTHVHITWRQIQEAREKVEAMIPAQGLVRLKKQG